MICICISENNVDTILGQLKGEEMAEIRLDLMTLSPEEIDVVFSQPLKLLATCRPGGLAEEERKRVLCRAIDAGAAHVDIEIDSSTAAFRKDMIAYANSKNCSVILSYHNFLITPSLEELHVIVSSCFEQGADIAKVACMVNHEDDAVRLLALYDDFDHLVSLGMGELGQITRVMGLSMGAPFTYAAPNHAAGTASGQLDKRSLLKRMKEM